MGIAFSTERNWRDEYLRTGWPKTTKFYAIIQTDILYSITEYDVTSCFRFEVVAKKVAEHVIFDDFRVEYLGNGLIQDPPILWT